MATTQKCDKCNGTGEIKVPPHCKRCDGYHIIHWYAPGYGPAISRCPDCEPTEEWYEAHTTTELCAKCEGLGWVRS